jgi:hypothetical protein
MEGLTFIILNMQQLRKYECQSFVCIFRAIDINSLIGNIGGYVGLLLGVSILQVPNLLLQLLGNVVNFYIKKRGQSVITSPDNVAAENGEIRSQSMLFRRTCQTNSEIISETRLQKLKNENDVAESLNDIRDNQI